MTYNQMISIARANGLEHEVDYTYGICLMAIGTDTPAAREQAANEALDEWDLN